MINENQPLGFAVYLYYMHFENINPYIISHVGSKHSDPGLPRHRVCFEFESCACP